MDIQSQLIGWKEWCVTLQPALRANKPTFSEEMEIKFKKQPRKIKRKIYKTYLSISGSIISLYV